MAGHDFRVIGPLLIEWGWFVKNQIVSPQIVFHYRFAGRPTVLVSSEWPNAGVSYVETVCDVSVAAFRVQSANRAPNYIVHWMAIGYYGRQAPLSADMQAAISSFETLKRSAETSPTEEEADNETLLDTPSGTPQ